jgi:hypothetical protein
MNSSYSGTDAVDLPFHRFRLQLDDVPLPAHSTFLW